MSWRNLTIGKKISVGFGVVLGLLCIAGALSYFGMGDIVGNAEEVILGNSLDGELAQRELDHLNWANQVNALLTDAKVTKLTVETDPHKCAFGKWLYGKGRQEVEKLVPSLAPLLKKIEAPHARLHASALEVAKHFQAADDKLPGFLAAREADHLKGILNICKVFLTNAEKLKVKSDPHKCAFGKWLYSDQAKAAVAGNPKLESLLEAIKEPHAKLHESAAAVSKAYRQIHPGLMSTLLAQLDDHHAWAQKVSTAILLGRRDLGVQMDPSQCSLGKWLASEKGQKCLESFPALAEIMAQIKDPHDRLHESARRIQAALAAGDRARAQAVFKSVTLPALSKVVAGLKQAIEEESRLVQAQNQAKQIFADQTQKYMLATQGILAQMRKAADEALAGQRRAREAYATQTLPALRQVQSLLHAIRAEAKRHIMTDKAMLASAQNARLLVSLVSAVAVVVGILLAFFIVRGTTAVLRRITRGMHAGSKQVAAASEQVASASQSLAQGASEQAANLEETSSSMEEMASMTRQNADNARQADLLMKEASQMVQNANSSMGELKEAMEQINQASDEMAKIIKTIDEIAFQTNLLALNAAVEAARAGEAGAGFAVVADEVRNLAMRAAEAAKDTSQLIEGNIAHIRQSSDLVHTTDDAFSQVLESVQKVGELVGEIAAASGEQAQGIDQINKAATEMDQVTQQVASNAEESAAASEELASQAQALQGMVRELSALVEGAGQAQAGNLAGRSVPRLPSPPSPPSPPSSAGGDEGDRRGKGRAGSAAARTEAEKAIPLEDDQEGDFGDF